MTEFVKVATTSDIPVGEGRVFDVKGRPIALFHVEGAFHAMDNTCLHQGGPLGEGTLADAVVTCPWHGWEYNVKTGVCELDATVKVVTFPVKVEGDQVFVQV